MAQATTTDQLSGRAEAVVNDAKAKGPEVATAFTGVANAFGAALNESLKSRPHATLAIAAGIGFLFGAAWSR